MAERSISPLDVICFLFFRCRNKLLSWPKSSCVMLRCWRGREGGLVFNVVLTFVFHKNWDSRLNLPLPNKVSD